MVLESGAWTGGQGEHGVYELTVDTPTPVISRMPAEEEYSISISISISIITSVCALLIPLFPAFTVLTSLLRGCFTQRLLPVHCRRAHTNVNINVNVSVLHHHHHHPTTYAVGRQNPVAQDEKPRARLSQVKFTLKKKNSEIATFIFSETRGGKIVRTQTYPHPHLLNELVRQVGFVWTTEGERDR